jgi:hypothetical protein
MSTFSDRYLVGVESRHCSTQLTKVGARIGVPILTGTGKRESEPFLIDPRGQEVPQSVARRRIQNFANTRLAFTVSFGKQTFHARD